MSAAAATAPKEEEGVAKNEEKIVPKKDEAGARELPAPKKDEAKKQAPKDEEEDEDDELLPEAQPTFERNEVDRSNLKTRDNALHVYGLDFLKTEHMNEIFGQFDHRYVEWLNDSSANIVFKTAASTKKALESLSYPKAGDDPWRRTPDILVNDDCPPVFLQMRLATPSDVKKSRKAVPTILQGDTERRAQVRDRRQAGRSNQPYRDGMTTDLLEQAGLLGKKRKPEAPTEEETKKRQKRLDRFGAEATLPAEKTDAAEPAPQVRSAGGATIEENTITPTEEERRKRAEKFSEKAPALTAAAVKKASVPADKAAVSTAKVAVAA